VRPAEPGGAVAQRPQLRSEEYAKFATPLPTPPSKSCVPEPEVIVDPGAYAPLKLLAGAACDDDEDAGASLPGRRSSKGSWTDTLAALERQEAELAEARNAPCPCGSGKKYKRCCGREHGRRGVFDQSHWLQLRTMAWAAEPQRKCRRVRCKPTVTWIRRGKSVFLSGVCTCGSGSACPHCTPLKRAEEAELVSALVQHHGQRRTYLFSPTTGHRADRSGEQVVYQELLPMVEGQNEAWRRMTKGDPWEHFCEKWGLTWMIRALDHRHSWVHGHHPHLHVLLAFGWTLTVAELAEVHAWLAARWTRMVVRVMGEDARPSAELRFNKEGAFIGSVGCTLTDCLNEQYVSKLGLELTLDESKVGKNGSRSPWQIYRDLAEFQRPEDGALWQQYARAMKGKQLVRFSGDWRAFATELVGKAKEEEQKREDAERQADGAEAGEETFDTAGPIWDEIRDLHGGTRRGKDAWSALARCKAAARNAPPGGAEAAVNAEIALLRVECAGQIAFLAAERQRQEEARAAELRREQEAHARRQAELAAQRTTERAAEAQDWRLRHRSILDALPWQEREAWLVRTKAAAFACAKPRRRGWSWPAFWAAFSAESVERAVGRGSRVVDAAKPRQLGSWPVALAAIAADAAEQSWSTGAAAE
jgi:hypothetical protein